MCWAECFHGSRWGRDSAWTVGSHGHICMGAPSSKGHRVVGLLWPAVWMAKSVMKKSRRALHPSPDPSSLRWAGSQRDDQIQAQSQLLALSQLGT